VKLAYRLLLIAGHTLGDLALPLMKRQCENLDTTMDGLTPVQAERLLPTLEKVLGAYMARPSDLKEVMHELRLEIGAERFARGEITPRGVEGQAPPASRAGPDLSGFPDADGAARGAHEDARAQPRKD
jgi:hypothetical protein